LRGNRCERGAFAVSNAMNVTVRQELALIDMLTRDVLPDLGATYGLGQVRKVSLAVAVRRVRPSANVTRPDSV
jgi:hypothetical protein